MPYKGIYRVHQRVAKDWRQGRIVLAGDAAHLNNPLGAFGLNGGLHDAILLADYLGKICRGEADERLLDLYVRKRRTANIDFVQSQSISNKQMLEEGDPAKRKKTFDELRDDRALLNPVFRGGNLFRLRCSLGLPGYSLPAVRQNIAGDS